LGLALLAAGVDGIEVGIASLSSFSEANLLVNRAVGYDMTRKYYIPDLLLTLPEPLAKDILSDSKNTDLQCGCPHCSASGGNLLRAAKPHFLHCRTGEVAELNARASTKQRLEWLRDKVSKALQRCDAIRKERRVDLPPTHYSHLRAWLQVFEVPSGGSR
jgi:hypothetical protein